MAQQMKTYIESKINELLKTSNPEGYIKILASMDADIRRLWKSERSNDNRYWSQVNSNKDIIDLIDNFDGKVSFVENYVPFGCSNIEDGYNMALAEYRAIQGLQKLAQFIDPNPFNKTNFTLLSEKEIDELFDRMYSIIKRRDQQDTRRAMQD